MRNSSICALMFAAAVVGRADSIPAEILDPNLQISTVISAGIDQPIGVLFLGPRDYLVLEKASGRIKRVTNGNLRPVPVADLAVNSASERGLLSAALHPNFPSTPYVYVRWTRSSTGADTEDVTQVGLMENRVDRFVWNGSRLLFDRNIVLLRARQRDNVPVSGHPGTNNPRENGNHNGGVMKFGPDGKLYIFTGDVGRRGQMQNLPSGPFTTAPFADDTLGGPAPDSPHLTGVILRLNDDGSAPTDNPFVAAGNAIGGVVGANIRKVFSYGHRNGFGMAFDPASGALWETENADDAFSEINRVVPGMNGGWIQVMGPLSRFAEFKSIETTMFGGSLQQVRYPPTRLAYAPALAVARMFMLPGTTYVDPDLSWRYEIAPSGAAFVNGNRMGAEHAGTMWMGTASSFSSVGGLGGSLFRLRLTPDRMRIDVSADPRLADRVADDAEKYGTTESETLVIGRGFGTVTDIVQGPDGYLYVVSLSDNTIYRISPRTGTGN